MSEITFFFLEATVRRPGGTYEPFRGEQVRWHCSVVPRTSIQRDGPFHPHFPGLSYRYSQAPFPRSRPREDTVIANSPINFPPGGRGMMYRVSLNAHRMSPHKYCGKQRAEAADEEIRENREPTSFPAGRTTLFSQELALASLSLVFRGGVREFRRMTYRDVDAMPCPPHFPGVGRGHTLLLHLQGSSESPSSQRPHYDREVAIHRTRLLLV